MGGGVEGLHGCRTPEGWDRLRGSPDQVVHGAVETAQAPVDAGAIDARLRAAMDSGEDMRAVIAALAVATGQQRRSIYARWQTLRHADDR